MITPADSPSSPADYDAVTPHGQGPAPYNIQAPTEDLSGITSAAGRLTGAGIVYPMSGRQSDTENLIMSPPGFADFDIFGGYSGGGGADWPTDVGPPGT
jgi:hypothetical protein